MKIIAVIVTCNRLDLLPRALISVKNQSRKPDKVYVISNSTDNNFLIEQGICIDFGFLIIRNYRTKNNAGALNAAIELIIKEYGVSGNLYFASLDDDDEWLDLYLETIEKNNSEGYDVVVCELSRNNGKFSNRQHLPNRFSIETFLKGNPGIGNSNTFVKLITLLNAGCFDESCLSNVDRDLFVRIFQLKPTYKIINQIMVIAYTDNERIRITNNIAIRVKSFKYFYYKYSHLMSSNIKDEYFHWVKSLFDIDRREIEIRSNTEPYFYQNDINFDQKGNYFEFIIGFVAGNDEIATRVVKQIIHKIPVDLIVIIDNTPKSENLDGTRRLLSTSNNYKVIEFNEWNKNLANGYYGQYLKKFDTINSICLGRTILHRHLYDESINFKKPVYWIIDDDIDFNAISTEEDLFELFHLINENLNKTDVIIGGISNDPPVPVLSCIRTQLVDFLHSYNRNNKTEDFLEIHKIPDYYYDLSDIHSNHLETPILKGGINENHLHQIFSGKAVFRPVLQKNLKYKLGIIEKRGANTIVLDRNILCLYPHINIELKDKFARRGDLTWALFNQLVSNKKVVEHTFCLNHNRPLSNFSLDKELEKSAYDIIGYALNKAIIEVIEKIKSENNKFIETRDLLSYIFRKKYFCIFLEMYLYNLNKRLIRFLMNYFRIKGLIGIIFNNFDVGKEYYEQFVNEANLYWFEDLLEKSSSEVRLIKFLEELIHLIEENNNIFIITS